MNIHKNPTAKNTKLLRARIEHGLSRADVAEKLNVGTSTVQSWENGTRFPSPEYRQKLCLLFGMTLEELGLLPRVLPHIEEVSRARNDSAREPSPSGRNKSEKNRALMLQRVKTRWITGVLDHLSNFPLLSVAFQMRQNAVAHSWRTNLLDPSPVAVVFHDTPIIDMYDHADGEFLILGEPGAGKTTLLLQLTRDLIERAMNDSTHPIPVLFNLSTWTVRQPDLSEWLIEELNGKYQIPRKLARNWIEQDHLLLLLDGLDDVEQDQRVACVKSMNAYRQEHGLVPVVVSSRMDDYMALPIRLVLGHAVVVEPLTPSQIDTYIKAGGDGLAAMRIALQTDPLLQEMVSTPLMLSIVTQAYQGVSIEELLVVTDVEERRRVVFETYVQRVLRRRKGRSTLPQTLTWMSWIAQHMNEYNQTELYIERMQPDWLQEKTQRTYRQTIIRIIFGLGLFMDAALYACFRGDSVPTQPGLFYWLGGKGLGNSILGWMAPGLGGIHNAGFSGSGTLGLLTFVVELLIVLIVSQKEVPSLSKEALSHALRRSILPSLKAGTAFSVFCALIYGIIDGFWYGISRGLAVEPYDVFLLYIMLGLTNALRYEYIRKIPPQKQQRHEAKQIYRRSFLHRLIDFLLFSLCGTVGLGSVYALESGGVTHLVMVNSIIVGVGLGILFGFGNVTNIARDLGTTIIPAEIVSWSWSEVRKDISTHLQKGLRLGGIIGIVIIVFLGCIGSLFNGFDYGLRYALVSGPIIGIVTGIAGILTGVLQSGWTSTMVKDEHDFIKPNEGIRSSFRHAFFAACLFGPVGGIVGGLINGFACRLVGVPGWSTLMLGFTLVYSIMFGVRAWLAYGGIAVIEHYVLRYYLWRAGFFPWDQIQFLDTVSDLLLLRKIGGGYMFTHRLLQDYFVQREMHSSRRETDITQNT